MQAILPKKLPIIGSAIAAYYTNVERRMVAAADAVVIIADEFADELHKLRMQPKRAATIPNWMPLDEMKPGEKINPWSIKNGLDKTTNIIYFGSVGLKQDEDLYVKFSEHFRPMREVRVVVIGGGYVMKGLKQQKVEKGLDNLVLLGWQSYEDVADILATGDVLLAAVNAQASLYSVPCKVLTYLSAGRPIIAAIPPANLVAKILIQNDMGLVVDPSNVDDVIRTADRLMRDAGLRQKFSELGRAYALRTFNIDTICSRFEGLFREV
jgi:glycosyltransferase involved in cell wall biosynthesis